MSTGSFENWAGTIAEIGPAYPFVGTEVMWVVLGIVFWIGWHIVQGKREAKEWEEDLKKFGGKQLPGEEYYDH